MRVLQGGTTEDDTLTAVAVNQVDGSMVFAGKTDGDWGKENAGKSDFVAMKLDIDGNLLWRWQVKHNAAGLDIV